jgi:uncharacterized protein YkwD
MKPSNVALLALVTLSSLSMACANEEWETEDEVDIAQASSELNIGSDEITSMLAAINAKRATGTQCDGVIMPSVPALKRNAKLDTSADRHAEDMAEYNFYSNVGSDGSTFIERITEAGYVWATAGENMAAGFANGSAVVNAWFSNSHHCHNLMSGSFTEIGFGKGYSAASSFDYYWVADFGKPK